MIENTDPSIAREVIVETLRDEYLERVKALESQPNQARRIRVGKLDEALKCRPQFANQWLREHILLEVLWELVREGLVRPYNLSPSLNDCSFWLTLRGRDALCNEGSPSHPRFLQGLVDLGLSRPACFYLEEALHCSSSPTAMVMMAGVAAEAIILELATAYCTYLRSQGLNPVKLENLLPSPKASIYQKVKEFVSDVQQRGPIVFRGYDAPLSTIESLYHAIAQNRNEAGHPSGKRFEYDEAEAHVNMVRVHAKRALEWMQRLHANTTP